MTEVLAIPEGLSSVVGDATTELAYHWEDFASVWRLDDDRFLKLRRTLHNGDLRPTARSAHITSQGFREGAICQSSCDVVRPWDT